MRRILTIIVLATLVALPSFAEYTVILRDGTVYKAKEKWKVTNGQALITLESGTQISLNPRLIDLERTEQANQLGLGDVRVINVEEAKTAEEPQQSLGSITTLRRNTPTPSQPTAQPSPTPGEMAGSVSRETISKFQRAYDNVGLFDASISSLSGRKLKISLTANNEDEVFKAISATAFLISNIDDVSDVQLLMATLNGGSAGKFEMTSSDAKALTEKHLTWHSYFVQKVIY